MSRIKKSIGVMLVSAFLVTTFGVVSASAAVPKVNYEPWIAQRFTHDAKFTFAVGTIKFVQSFDAKWDVKRKAVPLVQNAGLQANNIDNFLMGIEVSIGKTTQRTTNCSFTKKSYWGNGKCEVLTTNFTFVKKAGIPSPWGQVGASWKKTGVFTTEVAPAAQVMMIWKMD